MFWVQFNGMRYINRLFLWVLKEYANLGSEFSHPNSVTSKGGFSTMRTGSAKDSCRLKGHL